MNPDEIFTIKKAGIRDCFLINQLASQIWEPTYRDILSSEQLKHMFEWMYSIPSLEKQMSTGHHFFIVYEEVVPLGYMSIEKENNTRYHLQKIYVLPSQQGKGLGRFLIDEAGQFVRKLQPEGEVLLVLNVNRANKARFFYEKLGFSMEGQGDFDIGNGYYMNDYIMVKKI